jgi:hypothetical protein
MNWHELGLLGSILTFSGGGILSLDALRAPRRIREMSGANQFLRILKAFGRGQSLNDKEGNTLDSSDALALWFAARSRWWARAGFLLMTAGFLCDILERYFGALPH